MIISEMFYDENGKNNLTVDNYENDGTSMKVYHESKFDDKGRIIETRSYKDNPISVKNNLVYNPRSRKLNLDNKNNRMTSIIRIEYDEQNRIIKKTTESTESSLISTTNFSYNDSTNEQQIKETGVDKITGKIFYETSTIKDRDNTVSVHKKFDDGGKEIYINSTTRKYYNLKHVFMKNKTIDKTQKSAPFKGYKEYREIKYYDNHVWTTLDTEFERREYFSSIKNESGIEKTTMDVAEFETKHLELNTDNRTYEIRIQYDRKYKNDELLSESHNIYVDYLENEKSRITKLTIKIDINDDLFSEIEDLVNNNQNRTDDEAISAFKDMIMSNKIDCKVISYSFESLNNERLFKILIVNDLNQPSPSQFVKYLCIKSIIDDIYPVELVIREEGGDVKLDCFKIRTKKDINGTRVIAEQIDTRNENIEYRDMENKLLFSFKENDYSVAHLDEKGNKVYATEYRPNIEEKEPDMVHEVKERLLGTYYGVYKETIKTLSENIDCLEQEFLQDDRVARLVYHKSGEVTVYIPDLLSALGLSE